MILLLATSFATLCAASPAAMFVANRRIFLPPAKRSLTQTASGIVYEVSLLIPARDEAKGIEAAVRAALASEEVAIEVIVLDDHSTDNTAGIVSAMAQADRRVRLVAGKTLPEGWNGKQHACHQLASAASYDRLVFIDADVRLATDALSRLLSYQDQSGVALLSAFPQQETGTWLEKWIIPLMHFILLGFLPMRRMRTSVDPAYAAGCGQLFLTHQSDYQAAGTHAAIRASRHDGVKLPRAYRAAGLSTDVVDGTTLATCRMYTSAAEVIRGVLKNAIEGIANPKLIVPFTIILIAGTILPWFTMLAAVITGNLPVALLSTVAIVLSHLPRALAARQFRQSWQGVLFHTVSIALFMMLQWIALFNHVRGHKTKWRGRA